MSEIKHKTIQIQEQMPITQKGCCSGSCSGCKTDEPVLKANYNELNRVIDVLSAADSADIILAGGCNKLVFRIEGMCCATEIEYLKSALIPLLNDAELAFDLVNSKLIVKSAKGSLLQREKIIKAISSTGMKATLWDERAQQGKEILSFWSRFGHILMNIFSALGLIVGLLFQALRDGVGPAFGGGVEEGAQSARANYPPVVTIIFYSMAIISGSWFIFPKVIRALQRCRPDTNLLMMIATGGAIGINHWFEATISMYLFSVAELLESWNMSRARQAVQSLMELTPLVARVVDEYGIIAEKSVEQVKVDAKIIVRPGEKIPMDSKITLGSTTVNQAPITGESIPVHKEVGDLILAGTINGDATIECIVTKEASNSILASIIKQVEEAQSKRAKSDQFIEKFSYYYVPLMILVSAVVCIVPPLATGSSWYPWLYKGLELNSCQHCSRIDSCSP